MENAGKMVHMVKVKVKDCPKVVVYGVVYRDVTDLLFEETKYKKTYPTKKEWAKIREYGFRKVRVKEKVKMSNEEKRGKGIRVDYTEENIQRMIEMNRAGESNQAIGKAIDRTPRAVYLKLRELNKRGVMT